MGLFEIMETAHVDPILPDRKGHHVPASPDEGLKKLRHVQMLVLRYHIKHLRIKNINPSVHIEVLHRFLIDPQHAVFFANLLDAHRELIAVEGVGAGVLDLFFGAVPDDFLKRKLGLRSLGRRRGPSTSKDNSRHEKPTARWRRPRHV